MFSSEPVCQFMTLGFAFSQTIDLILAAFATARLGSVLYEIDQLVLCKFDETLSGTL